MNFKGATTVDTIYFSDLCGKTKLWQTERLSDKPGKRPKAGFRKSDYPK